MKGRGLGSERSRDDHSGAGLGISGFIRLCGYPITLNAVSAGDADRHRLQGPEIGARVSHPCCPIERFFFGEDGRLTFQVLASRAPIVVHKRGGGEGLSEEFVRVSTWDSRRRFFSRRNFPDALVHRSRLNCITSERRIRVTADRFPMASRGKSPRHRRLLTMPPQFQQIVRRRHRTPLAPHRCQPSH
jgi:hypothetical protein